MARKLVNEQSVKDVHRISLAYMKLKHVFKDSLFIHRKLKGTSPETNGPSL